MLYKNPHSDVQRLLPAGPAPAPNSTAPAPSPGTLIILLHLPLRLLLFATRQPFSLLHTLAAPGARRAQQSGKSPSCLPRAAVADGLQA